MNPFQSKDLGLNEAYIKKKAYLCLSKLKITEFTCLQYLLAITCIYFDFVSKGESNELVPAMKSCQNSPE